VAGDETERPNVARMYDYFLGGSHNFAADRDAAAAVLAAVPAVRSLARQNRAFLRRAVQHLVHQGIRQFLDLGSGIPTVGNVHEIAQRAAPRTRVVYVDIEPVAVNHSRALLAGNPDAAVAQLDLREPERVLASPEVRELLDLDRPVGLLAVAVLHFIPDGDDPWGVLAAYRDALAPGSHLVISHGSQSQERMADSGARTVGRVYGSTGTPGMSRTYEEIRALFDGWELVEPGLVRMPAWRPDRPDRLSTGDLGAELDEFPYGGVGRRP
jgi:SAM-dependent methyltransferase